MASLGSLAYAEDDGRHMLGIKAMQAPELSESLREGRREMTAQEEAEGKFCCHVLECDSEVRQDASTLTSPSHQTCCVCTDQSAADLLPGARALS